MNFRYLPAVITVATCLGTAPALSGEVCVMNGTDHAYLFVAEARGGMRKVAWLDPAQSLCSASTSGTGGVVSVFQSEDHLEGCSRLVSGTETETLLRYVDFDRCHWSSHDS